MTPDTGKERGNPADAKCICHCHDTTDQAYILAHAIYECQHCRGKERAEWEKELEMMDDQPCEEFDEAETSPMTNEALPHECPECGGTRFFCKNCHSDHHKGGWRVCFVKKLLSEDRARLREEIESLDIRGLPKGDMTLHFKSAVLRLLDKDIHHG